MRIPVIAIVGRPNVGKSTLFNAIVGERRAIVEDIPGVTRDRNYHYVERYSFPFSLVDTGGFDLTNDGEIERQVREQTRLAIEEADVLIVMFDGKTGLQPADEDVVDLVRKSNRPTIFTVNKCDGLEQKDRVFDFYSLGLENLHDLSALHGRNLRSIIELTLSLIPDATELAAAEAEKRIEFEQRANEADEELKDVPVEVDEELVDEPLSGADLAAEIRSRRAVNFAPVFTPGEGEIEDYERQNKLAEVVSITKPEDEIWLAEEKGKDLSEGPDSIELIKFAIVGRPNVGKSTLLNTLIGETRAITSAISGTTRDTLDAQFEYEEQKYLLTDTAGMRKEGRITDEIEKYAVFRTLRAISDADVAAIVINAEEGPTEQDGKIAGLIHEEGRGLLFVVNKWDLIEKDHRTAHEFKERMNYQFKFAPYAPVIYISALSGRRCLRILPEVRSIALNRLRRIPTGKLNRMLGRELRRASPPSYRGVPLKLLYANQVDIAPPRFALYFNQPKGAHFSYLRFIKNSIREGYAFAGTDIKLINMKDKARST